MPRKKKWTKKTIDQYQANIKDYTKFAPALKKYKRRKTLKRGEKAFITRIARAMRALSGPTRSVIPLNKEQADFMRREGNRSLIGGGIRAVSFRKLDRNARAKLINHELRIISKGRDWHHLPVNPPTFANLVATAEDLIDEARFIPNLRQRTLALWSANGGNYQGFFKMEGKQGLTARIREYFNKYKEQDDWLIGIAYFDE